MGFYKVVAKIGHRGYGKSGDMVSYIVAESMADARNYAKGYPGVKHHNAMAVLGSKEVKEREFVEGILTTGYIHFDYHTANESIQTLDNIAKSIEHVAEFTTIEGKMLKNFCNRYFATTDDKLRAEIDKEFVTWATRLINDKYNRENGRIR